MIWLVILLISGMATHYSDGLIKKVADNRGMSLQGYTGGCALNDCSHLGRTVWVEWGDGTISGPLRVVD